MARTIGKIKIKKLKALVHKVMEEEKHSLFGWNPNYNSIRYKVKDRVPEEWFDIWEMGWAEIDRIIDDEICKIIYK